MQREEPAVGFVTHEPAAITCGWMQEVWLGT
jgi:hypothetical protein